MVLYYINLLLKKGSMIVSYFSYNLEVICGAMLVNYHMMDNSTYIHYHPMRSIFMMLFEYVVVEIDDD